MRAKKLGVEIPKFDRKEWVKSSNPKFFERKYNYYDIFTTYLDCRMNISKTARKKNCHYDTVVFAINDIKIKVLEENKDLLDLFN